MPQAFLSHRSKDKAIVKDVGDYLKKRFIKVWLDADELAGGDSLARRIGSGINQSDYFLAFFSNDYFESPWCLEEFDRVFTRRVKTKVKIIPIILQPYKKLDFSLIDDEFKETIEDVFERNLYVEIDKYKPKTGFKRIAESIWKDEPINFFPIEPKTVDGIEIQHIEFDLKGQNLLPDFLSTWNFRIEYFIADNKENRDGKPIVHGIPVAFSGKGPNWLLTALTIHFKNRRDVFLYNTHTEEYTCAYTKDESSGLLGTVLKG